MKHAATSHDAEVLHRLLLTIPHRLDVAISDLPEHEWRGVIRPQVIRAAHESGDVWAERQACKLVAEFVITHDEDFKSGQVDRCLAYLKGLTP